MGNQLVQKHNDDCQSSPLSPIYDDEEQNCSNDVRFKTILRRSQFVSLLLFQILSTFSYKVYTKYEKENPS